MCVTTVTPGLKKNEIKRIYLRATFISFVILLFFSLLGQALLNGMGININSFKIIGGLFLIFIAFEMVFEKVICPVAKHEPAMLDPCE